MAQLTEPVNDRDWISGPADAPITLVEYGDFECPYCGMAHPILKRIQAQLGDQLCLVYRHFPLRQSHPHAEHAAEASEAAGAQGRFWPMHDMLFEHQDALEDPDLVRYAAAVGCDAQQVATALATGMYEEAVREDFRSGVRSGVNGTPTFFINGERYDGMWADEAAFLQALRASVALR